jgi:hypothetical protein
MRVMHGRGDWRPGVRIESLVRYAFIGDSHAYGAGVAPDQTLSANAERQMNELLPAWPVEAVNFGVCGYNLWNSWLAFKDSPQVYDGLVIALCNNDADFFDRTYMVHYSEPHHTRWESTHPFGAAITRCFNEIAQFSQEKSLEVAVVFFSAHSSPGLLRISEIIGGLCSSRNFCFIDTLTHYRDLNFPGSDVYVSPADFHPSAKAHEAIGRYLATTLKRSGWFARHDRSTIEAAPDRILATARAMVTTDNYPPDVALNWALLALKAKSRLASRMEALGAGENFSVAGDRVKQALGAASRRWHMANRMRAFIEATGVSGPGIAAGLFRGETERLRLDELSFALDGGEWPQISARSFEPRPPQESAPAPEPKEAADFFDECTLELKSIRDKLAGLSRLAVPAAVGRPHEEALILADLEILARQADRAQAGCAALRAAFLRIEDSLKNARAGVSEIQAAHISGLIGASLRRVKGDFGFLQRWAAALQQMLDEDHTSFTTVEVTLSAEPIEGKPNCLLVGQVEYRVPHRFPFEDAGNFFPDGSSTLLKLCFPTLYAGRISFLPYVAKSADSSMLKVTLIKVDCYNRKSQRQAVDVTSFYRNKVGRYFSPHIYLR